MPTGTKWLRENYRRGSSACHEWIVENVASWNAPNWNKGGSNNWFISNL